MSSSHLTLHYDLWTFSSSTSAWDASMLALRFLHAPQDKLRVTTCRGSQGLHFVLDDTGRFEDLILRHRPTVVLVEGAPDRGTNSEDFWALRFILSPMHAGWVDSGSEPPQNNAAGSDAWRIAHSVQATVAWNQPARFPTVVAGFHKGDREELERRLSALLSAESTQHAPMEMLGAADILAEGGLRVGLREFLGEHPLLAPSLAVGLDRLHDYVFTLGAGTARVAEALLANGAERLSTPQGELLRLPDAQALPLKSALIRRGLLPGDRPETVRNADETAGEFRLPDGRLFLTRRRKRELEKRGYWTVTGPGDETVLLPLETHCAAIGLPEDEGLEIVVQREHASRLRDLVSAHVETMGGVDAPETVLAVYTQALLKWPFGGFFGRSTEAFLVLLRRIVAAGGAKA